MLQMLVLVFNIRIVQSYTFRWNEGQGIESLIAMAYCWLHELGKNMGLSGVDLSECY